MTPSCTRQEPNSFMPNHLEARAREISRYTTIFIAEDNGVGSGTFVHVGGLYGILTADHVVKKVFKFEEFFLCISDQPHDLLRMSRGDVDYIPIGPLLDDTQENAGPDLALLIIRGEGQLVKLRESKAFYSLDAANRRHFGCELRPTLWAVAGTFEDSLHRSVGDFGGIPLTRLTNLVAIGEFESRWIKDDFDYIQIKVAVGKYGFPSNYLGISGGGFWLAAIADQRRIHVIATPLLAGVEFYQSAPKDGERILTGHGFDSIYSALQDRIH